MPTKLDLQRALEEYRRKSLPRLIAIRRGYESLQSEQAIEFAAKGLNADESLNDHQYRIGYSMGEAASEKVEVYTDELKKTNSFKGIFEITEIVRKNTKGLGDLWSYDTACRIGFNRRLLPRSVYLQCGALRGAKKILREKLPRSARYLPVSAFPEPLQALEPYELENFLCVWNNRTNNSLKNTKR